MGEYGEGPSIPPPHLGETHKHVGPVRNTRTSRLSSRRPRSSQERTPTPVEDCKVPKTITGTPGPGLGVPTQDTDRDSNPRRAVSSMDLPSEDRSPRDNPRLLDRAMKGLALHREKHRWTLYVPVFHSPTPTTTRPFPPHHDLFPPTPPAPSRHGVGPRSSRLGAPRGVTIGVMSSHSHPFLGVGGLEGGRGGTGAPTSFIPSPNPVARTGS